jgi:hypothetical protein
MYLTQHIMIQVSLPCQSHTIMLESSRDKISENL